MNDYYKVDLSISPASTDACDLLADALADAGYESFEPADDGSTLTAYVQAQLYKPEGVDSAIESLPIQASVSYESTFVEGQDWNSEWEKNYFQPIVVAGRVAVHSSFHTDVPAAEHDIVIDPRMAFGTGHHATTTLMMLSLLDGNDVAGAQVIDMGTGTGILAILASMLGAKEIKAIEIDPFAAENAADNVRLNLPDNRSLEVIEGDASALERFSEYADVFLANINRNIITADIRRYAAAMKSGARLTVSGFYVEDREIVSNAATAAGLTLRSVADMDNWSSMTFVKSSE